MEWKKDAEQFGESVTEEAIPAAIRVKEEMVDARTSCIRAQAAYVRMKMNKKEASRELADFLGSLTNMWLLLREKFDRKKDADVFELDKLRKMDPSVQTASYDKWCGLFDRLNRKMEDLKITKIERYVPEEGRELA